MSLLVAAIEDNVIWMVSDTAVTGGSIQLRQREYQPKVEPSADRTALLGFCGDSYHGTRISRLAGNQESSERALNVLLTEHRHYPETEFAYGYFDQSGPHLVRIAEGSATEALTMHIGIHQAFEELQRIRHSEEIDAAPKALKKLMGGVVGNQKTPNGLGATVIAMYSLFPNWIDRSVGGWAIPYLLNNRGALFYGHVFSCSDPIFDQIAPGSIVPAGTAEAGGFDVSVTELDDGGGIVTYWLQRSVGDVFLKTVAGYDRHTFEGSPAVFKDLVTTNLDKTAHLWFGDRALGPIRSVKHMRDRAGNITSTIAYDGESLSIAIHNVETPFESKGVVELTQSVNHESNIEYSNRKMNLLLSKDGHSVDIEILTSKAKSSKTALTVAELDLLIARLGEIRTRMAEAIPLEVAPGSRLMMVPDPIWRAETAPHPGVNGLVLRLRHPGFGWLAFILPYHEASAMGTWLFDNANTQQSEVNVSSESVLPNSEASDSNT